MKVAINFQEKNIHLECFSSYFVGKSRGALISLYFVQWQCFAPVLVRLVAVTGTTTTTTSPSAGADGCQAGRLDGWL